MTDACRVAKESVDNNWGGSFGAVIVQDGEITPEASTGYC